jgi:hypothetical protein
MKPNTVVLAVSPGLVSFSPGKRANPRRLGITVWQTHAWIKSIVRPEANAGASIRGCAFNTISVRMSGHRAGKGRMSFLRVMSRPFRKLCHVK